MKFVALIKASVTFLGILALASCATSAGPSADSEKVVVSGIGDDIESAKLAAIRNALSRSIPQYVVADRKIVNDNILRDVTVSSMTGYITSIEIIETHRDTDGFVAVTAVIGVSKDRVRDYLAKFETSTVSGGDQFDGQTIAAEVFAAKSKRDAEKLRKAEQLKTAKALTSRLFSGYPYSATEVNVTEIKFDPETPDYVVMTLAYDLSEEWRNGFWRRVGVIDELLMDSGARDHVEICPSSGSVLDNCKKLPSNDLAFEFWSQKGIKHKLYVPIFDRNNTFVTCIEKTLAHPILANDPKAHMDSIGEGLADLGVGVGALAGTLAIGLPVAVIAGVLAPVTGLPDDVENPWPKPQKSLYVRGPNPHAVDFKPAKEDALTIDLKIKSSRLFNDERTAEFYEPFVIGALDEALIREFQGASEGGSSRDFCEREGTIQRMTP
jgi:hypothetical protein